MSEFHIRGGKRLAGVVTVQGAKNAVLPILAATVISGGENYLRDCPRLRDVENTVSILRHLGARVRWEKNGLWVDTTHLERCDIPEDLMGEMRSSVIFLGAVSARCKRARIWMPGGCDIGLRPIDLHLKALRDMGIELTESGGCIRSDASHLSGGEVHLAFPSVGATENAMLSAAGTERETVITNAAREPEIRDLADYLVKIGVSVRGAGTDTIALRGAAEYHGAEHRIIPDRIAAATYLCAAMITGGEVTLRNVREEHLKAVLFHLRECGGRVTATPDGIRLSAPERLRAAERIVTGPYPGFPTDAQSLFLSMLTQAEGSSMITETMFENRFRNVEYLCRMGASVRVSGRVAVVTGKTPLSGMRVPAPDLRGGASLVLAALAAEGESVVENGYHLDRGYERLAETLGDLGANIKRLE